ncbi:MAG: YigZ family protein [Bacillota bacterium]|nr:YigZ family protein [Bacillota bacterium]NLL27135.1 YigZ family protein [Erysipelotrichia bacterium]
MFNVKEKVVSLIEVKKSKFYCILLPIKDDENIKNELAEIKKEYPGARHYCYGAVIGDITRSNDDGEPASTAGRPILETLLNHQLDNVLAVVVRYFGGTLLGTAGLIRAYSQATSEAIKMATLTVPTTVYNYKITADYNLISSLEYLLSTKAVIKDRIYDEMVTYFFQSEEDISQEIKEVTSGQYSPEFISEEIIQK